MLKTLLLTFLVALYEGVDRLMKPCIRVARNSGKLPREWFKARLAWTPPSFRLHLLLCSEKVYEILALVPLSDQVRMLSLR